MNAPLLRHPVPGRILLGAALIAASWPAQAADFTIENWKASFGTVVVSSPRIEVKGSALERETFLGLLGGNAGDGVAARIARLDADEIVAPELILEQSFGSQKQVTRYFGIRFSNIRQGLIARGESARATVGVTGAPTGAMSGEMKRMSFEGLDLRQTARVLTERAQPGVTETMQPLLTRFEQEGYTLDMSEAGKISLGRTTGRGFAAKVGEEPLAEVLQRLAVSGEAAEKAQREGKSPDLSGEEGRRMSLSMISLLDMFSYGSGEARDFVVSVTPPATPGQKPAPKPEPISFSMNRISYGEDAPAKSGFGVEGLSFAGGGAKGQIALMSHSGFSIANVITALKAELASANSDLTNVDFRKFIPTFGTMRLEGVDVEAPQAAPPVRRGQQAVPAPAPAPIRIGLKLFELKAGEQINGIPTSLGLTVDGLKTPVVETAGNPAARDLIAMGYRDLDLSAKLDLAWDALKNEVAIRTLSLGGVGMATLEAKGTLSNVTKDLFSSDTALAQVAALGATARGIEARLRNAGLVEKLIENEARKAKRKPDEMRQQYAMMATLGLSAILGPSDGAKTLTNAIARFVARPGTLSIGATAKSASGLGLADVITLSDPTEVFDKIDVTADAQ